MPLKLKRWQNDLAKNRSATVYLPLPTLAQAEQPIWKIKRLLTN